LKKFLNSLLMASFLVYGVGAYAAELKIGYVQVDKILQEAPQTAETGKKLEKEFSPSTQ
jgi:outer membrane protein